MGITRQSAQNILMVRPARFASNTETLQSNAFQQETLVEQQSIIHQLALKEFDELVFQLRKNEVNVLVMDDTIEPDTPDAIFPNNWLSLHADGRVVLYPMEAPNRRHERRQDILIKLESAGFKIKKIEDLSVFEEENRVLEGTGSIVFDHQHRKAYACLSSRTDKELLKYFALKLAYEPVIFEAKDNNKLPIYHTNVMMCIGTGYAVICAESIPEEQRSKVLNSLEEDGLEIITISMKQMYQFAGNMLEVRNVYNEKILVLSQSAVAALDGDQKRRLSAYARLLPVDLPTIEQYGGGSARCMIAENFLKRTER